MTPAPLYAWNRTCLTGKQIVHNLDICNIFTLFTRKNSGYHGSVLFAYSLSFICDTFIRHTVLFLLLAWISTKPNHTGSTSRTGSAFRAGRAYPLALLADPLEHVLHPVVAEALKLPWRGRNRAPHVPPRRDKLAKALLVREGVGRPPWAGPTCYPPPRLDRILLLAQLQIANLSKTNPSAGGLLHFPSSSFM